MNDDDNNPHRVIRVLQSVRDSGTYPDDLVGAFRYCYIAALVQRGFMGWRINGDGERFLNDLLWERNCRNQVAHGNMVLAETTPYGDITLDELWHTW